MGRDALMLILYATMTRKTVMSRPSLSATSDGWIAKALREVGAGEGGGDDEYRAAPGRYARL